MKKMNIKKANQKGFTLAEVLITIAIIAILGGVAVFSASTMIRNTRQKTLDKMAETIFLVAERNIQKSYWVEGSNVLGAPGSGVLEVRNTDTTADLVLPQSTVSDEIYSSKWLISYEVGFQNCHIKEVYCTTSDNEYAASFSSNSASDLASVWSSGEGKVGYYGGGAIDELPDTTNLSTDKMYAAVKVENDEELGVGIYIQLPAENKNPSYYDGDVLSPKNVKYKLSVTGLTSNAVFEFDERELIKGSSTFTYQGKTKNCYLNGSGYAIYRDYIVLDNLSSPSTQFKNVVKASTEGLALGETASGLIPGEDILVEISATCVGTEAELTSDNINLSGTDVTQEVVFFTDDPSGWGKSAQTNSLFAARAVGATATAPDTVEIIYGRHLQNLDATTSGMPTADGNKKIAAIQKANIDFADVSGSYNNNWAQLYNATTNVRFKPIINLLLTKYDGGIDSNSGAPHYISGLKITQTNEDPRGIITGTSSKDLAGLMGCFFGDEISNVHLKNCELNTTSSAFVEAGLLAGRTSQVDVVQIKNCLIEESTVTNNRSTVDAYGYGITGGFVGVSRRGISFDKCQIKKSTITSKDQSWYTGGFVGATSEKGTVSSTTNTYQVNIKDCLVDTCTIHNRQSSAGSSAGGYIGYVNSNQITIADSYVVDSNISAYVGANSSVVGGLVGWFMVKTEATLTNCGVYTTLPENKKLDEFFIESTGNSNGTNVGGGLIACAVVKKLTMDNCFAAMKVNIGSNNSTRPAGGLIGGVYSSFGGITYSGPISITNSYADCYIHGTKVGGLVGHYELNSQVFSFENCYSAGCIDGDKTTIAAGIVPAKATIKNSYSLFNFDNVFDTAKFVPAELTYDSEGYVGSYPSEAAPAKATMQMYALAMDDSSVESSYYTYGGEVEEQANIGEYKNIRDIVEEPGKGAKTGSVNMFILGVSTNVAAKNAYEYADAFAGKLKGDEAGKSVIPNIISTLPHFGDWVERSGNQFWARIYKTSESGDKYVMFFEKGMPKKGLPTNSDIKLTCVGEWVADDGKAVPEGTTPAANSGFLKQADVLPTDSDQSATTKEAKAKLIAPWQYTNTDTEKFGWKTDYAANYATILQKITTVTFDEDFCKDTNASPAVSIAKPLSMRKWFKNFRKVTKFNNIKMLDVSNVTSLEETFRNCYEMTAYDLDGWDTAKVTSMRYMFGNNMLEDGTVSNSVNNQSLHGKATSFIFGDKFVTSNVVNMERMFQRQDGLNSTNDDAFNAAIHNFDVSKVKDISFMFSDCHNISKLDLSNWDTSSVENMDAVFYRSTKLADINVTGKFSTVNATTMWALFDMWPSNNVLTTLDVRNFDTSKVKNMAYIFSNNAKLTTIYATSKFTVEALATGSPQKKDDYGAYNTTTDSLMFKDCPVLVGGCGTAWKDKSSGTRTGKTYAWIDGRYVNKFTKNGEGFFTNEDYPEVFARIYENNEAGKYTMYFEYGSWADNGHSTAPLNEWKGNGPDQFINAAVVPWNSYNKKRYITEVIFTEHFYVVAKPVYTGYWFNAFYELREIVNSEKLNTSRVTDMRYMFTNCDSLWHLNLSEWDTSKVTHMNQMFSYCDRLAILELDKFSLDSIVNMDEIYRDSPKMLTIYASEAFTAPSSVNATHAFYTCSRLVGQNGTECSGESGTSYGRARVDGFDGKAGYYTDYTLKKDSGSALVVKTETENEYVLNIYSRNSNKYRSDKESYGDSVEYDIPWFSFTGHGNGWKSYRSTLIKAKFHDKNTLKPTSMAYWFYSCSKFAEIDDMKQVDTSLLKDMTRMFSYSKIKTFDFENWDVSAVEYMGGMFDHCSLLTQVDLSTWNATSVKKTNLMFSYCPKLEELDISGLTSDNLINMDEMYRDDPNLLTIYATNAFTAPNTIYATHAFYACTKLVGGNGTECTGEAGTSYARARIDGYESKPGYYTDVADKKKVGSALVVSTDVEKEHVLHLYAYQSDEYKEAKEAFGDLVVLDIPKFAFAGHGNGWKGYRGTLVKAVFHDRATLKPTSMAYWFYSCSKFVEIDDMTQVDTSLLKDMTCMFSYSKIKTFDFENWDVSAVEYMGGMFDHCSELTKIDLSTWNATSVKKTNLMFAYCGKLKEIDIREFSSANLTNMDEMYRDDPNLLTIYATNAFTAPDTIYATHAFYACTKLVGGKGTECSGESGTSYARARVDGHEGKPGYYTDPADKDKRGSALVVSTDIEKEHVLHLYAFQSDEYKAAKEAFGDLVVLDIPEFNFAGHGNGWKGYRGTLVKAVFHDRATLKPTSMAYWFYSCSKFAEIDDMTQVDTSLLKDMTCMFSYSKIKTFDFENWDVSAVEYMGGMFDHCSELTKIDLSTWNVTNVKKTNLMFAYCGKLKEIDIRGFSSANLTNMDEMYRDDPNLLTIYATNAFTAPDTIYATHAFYACTKLVGGKGTECSGESGTSYARARVDGYESKPGYYTDPNDKDNRGSALVVSTDVEKEHVLHLYAFQSDEYKAAKEAFGDLVVLDIPEFNFAGHGNGWKGYRGTLVKAVFHDRTTLKPTSMAYWFYSCTKFAEIDDMTQVDTSLLKDMTCMFSYSKIKTFDFENWDVSAVEYMGGMFDHCSELTKVDLSTWNVTNVKKTNLMFAYCGKLKEIDIRGFSSANLTNMDEMYRDDPNLLTIYATNAFTAPDTIYATHAFYACTKLVGGKGTECTGESGTSTSRARVDGYDGVAGYYTDPADKVNRGSALVVSTDTENENILHIYAFQSDEYIAAKEAFGDLVVLDIPEFNFAGHGNGWKGYRGSIVKVIFHDQATLKPTSMSYWFYGCIKLTELDDMTQVDTSMLKDISYMFSTCRFSDIDLENWNVSALENMEGIFKSCAYLKVVDMSTWNAANVKNTKFAFSFCSQLEEIDVSGLGAASLTNMDEMYRESSKLRTIYATTAFTAPNTLNATHAFYACNRLVGGNGTTCSGEPGTSYARARVDGYQGQAGYYTDASTKATGELAYIITNDGGNTTLHLYYANSGAYKTDKNTYTNNATLVVDGTNCMYSTSASQWDTYRSQITNVVFHDSTRLKPTSFEGWFADCTALTAFDTAGAINTSAATSLKRMFEGCTSLTTLDVKKWDVSHVTNMDNMFNGCSALTTVHAGKFDTTNVTSSTDMFNGCTSIVGGNHTAYDGSHTDSTYACVDLPGRPGYFTGDITYDSEYPDIMSINITMTSGRPAYIYYYNGVFYATRNQAAAQYLADHPEP